MLIVIVIVAIVAVAAIAGAVLLTNNNQGSSGSNDNNNNNNGNTDNTGGTDNNTLGSDLANGDYMEFRTTTESIVMTMNMTLRWEVSKVSSTGYDITLTLTSDIYNYSTTQHANKTDVVGKGAIDSNYTRGTLVGTETLSTPFGTKQVEHWRLSETDGSVTTITDYYIGKDTKMVYKWVVTSTDSSDSNNNSTSTTLLVQTNISSIRNGDKA